MSEPTKLLVSPREAAQLLSICERTLWSLTKSGQIGCVRIGASKRYSLIELHRFIAQREGLLTEGIAPANAPHHIRTSIES